VRDRGIRLLVHCALPRPSRKCPSPRWAAVFGRWFPTPRRTSAFCWCIQRARGHWRLPIGQARRLHAKHSPTPWEFALRLSDRLPRGRKYNASGMRGLCATAHKTWAHPMGCPHFALREHSSGTRVQEPVPFTPDHTVALAYSRFETRAVEDSNATTMITNQSGVL